METGNTKTLFDALEAAFAYDQGATDSGFRDEERIAASMQALHDLGPDGSRIAIGKWCCEAFLSDEALAQGYGAEDVAEFHEWLREEFGKFYWPPQGEPLR